MIPQEQEIHQLRLEILTRRSLIKQAISGGTVFEDIKEETLRVKELQKKLDELLNDSRPDPNN